ncbi:MAG: hypothetical protein KAI18_00360 [Candidatus Aenigmarchaeota archaeon]|nr:hypothetical protein [Candidatus Aenigmarchaeota archaeon]
MKFSEFRIHYEAKDINIGDILLTTCPRLFRIGSIEAVTYDKPKNTLNANIEVSLKNPVYLERKPSVGHMMAGIRFKGDQGNKKPTDNRILNRNEQIYYFVAEGHKKLSDIFEEQVSIISPLNSKMNPVLKNHFKTIIEYMETADEITTEGILDIFEEIPDMYYRFY